jgi:heptose-I-phosphate ethanolaminephosphotransferase
MGAHALYKNRYPSEFAKFNGMKNDLSDFQSATYNEYDNSILYQDYVLTNLFQTIRDNEKFFSAIYFPDHGEEVFQAAQFSGHTEAKQTINMFEIPMLFDSTSDKLNLIAKRRAYELWSIEDFIHSLHGLLDVETQYYDDKRDFFSPAYKEIPRKTGKSIYQVQKK